MPFFGQGKRSLPLQRYFRNLGWRHHGAERSRAGEVSRFDLGNNAVELGLCLGHSLINIADLDGGRGDVGLSHTLGGCWSPLEFQLVQCKAEHGAGFVETEPRQPGKFGAAARAGCAPIPICPGRLGVAVLHIARRSFA